MLPHRQVVEQVRVVRHIGQGSLGRDRLDGQVVPCDQQPAAGRRQDACQRSKVVVLPAPLGPTRPRTSPGSTAKLMPATATVSP